MESIAQIKEKILSAEGDVKQHLLAAYAEDTRKGVQAILASEAKKEAAWAAELLRLEGLMTYEQAAFDAGEAMVAGTDEVGRGPLAGPVVAAAVILPADCRILGINDSKKLSPEKREALFEEISEKAVSWAYGMVSPEKIDEMNILQASFYAMRQAIAGLSLLPNRVLVDGNQEIPGLGLPQQAIIGGDGKSQSIAAASIMAKVIRDRMMVEYDESYPAYGFAQNKGYGAPAHLAALREVGPCPIHRRTFIKNLL